jgi:hypothetical protein
MKKMCQRHGIVMEKTAHDKPKQNGVVERHLTLIHQRAYAQLLSAGLDKETRSLLWAASEDMMNTLENIMAMKRSVISADKLYTGQ